MRSFAALLALFLQLSAVAQAGKFKWFGSNVSGAEFGSNNIPGTLGVDYTWPNITSVTTLRHAGMNIFRVPFLMERLVPNQMTGQPDQKYLVALQSTVKQITDMGAYVVVDPHNFGRYYGQIISSPSQFQSFWATVASKFSTNHLVIFDTNNEYHDLDQTLVLNLNQAAVNGIRSAGAASQYIFVEGNSYSGAWTWPSVNDNLKTLADPQNKIIYEMNQYLDSDGSGTSSTCVNSTVGAERITAATQWLKTNGKKGFLGEFAGGANSQCEAAVRGMLDVMLNNTDVWLGAEWWAAGPWWGDYIFSMEPPKGIGYLNYLSILQQYFA